MLPEFFQEFLFNYGYWAVFIVLLICGAGFPLPEDITLISAGIISGLGQANLYVMIVVSYLGIIIGDTMMYGIGCYFGGNLREKPLFQKIFLPERMQQIDDLFQKYGNRVIFVARFLPGLRAPIYVISGMTKRVKLSMFILMDSIAAILSVPVFVYIGHYGAENREWIMKTIGNMKEFAFWGVIIFAIYLIVRFYLSYRRRAFFRNKRKELRLLRRNKNKAL